MFVRDVEISFSSTGWSLNHEIGAHGSSFLYRWKKKYGWIYVNRYSELIPRSFFKVYRKKSKAVSFVRRQKSGIGLRTHLRGKLEASIIGTKFGRSDFKSATAYFLLAVNYAKRKAAAGWSTFNVKHCSVDVRIVKWQAEDRRGSVELIYSDNGNKLVGAERVLRPAANSWNQYQIYHHLRQCDIQWNCNHPIASHMVEHGSEWFEKFDVSCHPSPVTAFLPI